MWLIKIIFSLLIVLTVSCQLPPASYILFTPLNFSCSTDYNPTTTNAEAMATWSSKCTQSSKTWLRFIVYANQTDINGFVLYKSTTEKPHSFFTQLIQKHIVNKQILTLPNIVPFIYSDSFSPSGDTCLSKGTDGIDRGQTYPTIYVSSPPQYIVNTDYESDFLNKILSDNLTSMTQRETSIIIPPLECLGTGYFVVSTVDYINKAESSASNVLVLT